VLKNDQRRGYNELVEKAGDMDFKVKMQGERFSLRSATYSLNYVRRLFEMSHAQSKLCDQIL